VDVIVLLSIRHIWVQVVVSCLTLLVTIKEIVHTKMEILSSHPHVIPNLYNFILSVEHKRRYFEKV